MNRDLYIHISLPLDMVVSSETTIKVAPIDFGDTAGLNTLLTVDEDIDFTILFEYSEA